MPTITVQVKEIGSTVRGDFNMVQIKGVDAANGKNVTKTCFETTKSGDLTKNAQIAEGLVEGDFIEMVLDDSSYKNLKTIKKVAAPEGGVKSGGGARSGASYSGKGSSGSSSDRMSKEEWAAKDAKKDASVARSVALKAAVETVVAKGFAKGKDNIEIILDVARKFEAYLNPVEAAKAKAKAEPAEDDDGGADEVGDDNQAPDYDDDIPF